MQTKIQVITFVTSLLIMIFSSLHTFKVSAQNEDSPILSNEKTQVIDSIALFMAERYVFADKGEEMGNLIKQNLKDGKYDEISSHQEFASVLSQDLQTINNDRHIGVVYNPERIALIKKAENDENNKELEILEKKNRESVNFSFKEIKILPGNVGYLKFNGFMDARYAGPTAVAAMNFLAYTDALIIDLRDNGGGSPSLIQLITSYFFEDEEHLNSFYIREGERTNQFWTLPYVPGKKLLETDLYVLTSSRTFSGAEEFSYNLKNLERATIVGETTGGGAHPVSGYIVNDNFMVRVPFGRAVNPISNTNWEGTGVEPDVKVEKEKAFNKAYILALENLIEKETDKETLYSLNWGYEGLMVKSNPVVLDEKLLKSYTGKYGPRNIMLEDGVLYYQREDRPKMKMIPMNEHTFMFNEIDYFRLKIIIEDGKATAVEGRYDNGMIDRSDRT